MARPAVLILALSGAVLASACSTVGHGAVESARMTRHGLRDAVSAPFKDFGLVKAKVPEILQKASNDPYLRPARSDCAYLAHEVAQLDLALGPDVDTPRDAGKPTLVGRGSRAVSDAALDAVRDLTTGWIPFRSTVRRLTGAADNQDEIEDAAHAGGLRRAYLKGLGLQMGCAYPAAPMPLPPPDTVIAAQTPARAAVPAAVGTGRPAQAESPVQATPVSSSAAAVVVPGG